MPKLKTNKSAKKRFKITGTGKVKRNKKSRRHLLTDKTTAKKRKMRKPAVLNKSDENRIKVLLPYN